jgi:hypothetical protein
MAKTQWLQRPMYDEEGQPAHLQPHVGSYNIVIKANQRDPSTAERLFDELLRAEQEVTSGQLQPTTDSYSFVIHSWAKHDPSRASMWRDELMNIENQKYERLNKYHDDARFFRCHY